MRPSNLGTNTSTGTQQRAALRIVVRRPDLVAHERCLHIKAVKEKKQVAHAAAHCPRFRVDFNELEVKMHALLVPRAGSHTPRPSLTCSVMSWAVGAVVPISESNLRWSAVPMLHVRTQCIACAPEQSVDTTYNTVSRQLPPL